MRISDWSSYVCSSDLTRNLYVMGAFAEAEIIESFVTDDAAAHSLSNHVTEIMVRENAKLQQYNLQIAGEQSSYINQTEVHKEKNSRYKNYKNKFHGEEIGRNNKKERTAGTKIE